MNLRRMMFKLQTALCQKGRIVKIDQCQIYSERLERMVTKYVLKEKQYIKRKNGKTALHDVTLLESFQAAEVIKALADMLGGD